MAEAYHVPFSDVHEAMGRVPRCCPSDEELNRYVLRVRGLPNQPVRVTWGRRALVFTREQLEAGEFSF